MDRNIGSSSTPRRRQVLSPMNMQIGSSQTEEGLKTYTKQEVEMLLKDRFRGNKFDSKGKQQWTIDYIKRLKVCLKWLQDVVDEKDSLETALKSQEEEFKVTVSKLETDILQLQDELREAHRANKQLESEKADILQELSTLRADNTFHAHLNIPDPFSLLHEDILLDIMSRIECTTIELIRTTSTISKRWQNLWASVPHLIFLEEEDGVDPDTNIHGYISFIDNTINQCPTYPNLKLFKLNTNYNSLLNPEFKSRVNSWIRYAISRNVEELDLLLWGGQEEFTYDDELFFNSSCITRIKLYWCLLNPPNGVINWGRLESLCISCGTLDEDMLEKILSGSPRLETLQLDDCYGYRRINITSKSVKKLVFSGYNSHHEIDRDEDYIDCVKINAPYISSLTIEGELVLRELALLNLSSLVEANLDYSIDWRGISQEEIFRGLLKNLNLEQIRVGDQFSPSEFLSRLEDIRVGDEFSPSEFLTCLEASRDTSNDDLVENGDQEEESD